MIPVGIDLPPPPYELAFPTINTSVMSPAKSIERCCGKHQSLFITYIIIISNHIKGNLEFLEQCHATLPLFSNTTDMWLFPPPPPPPGFVFAL